MCVTTSSSDTFLIDSTLGMTLPRLGKQKKKRQEIKNCHSRQELIIPNLVLFGVGAINIFVLSA